MKTVEFLQYTLRSGTGNRFYQIMLNISVPLHQAAGIDVVTHGPSDHDPDSYLLVRAFENPELRERSLHAFYQSDAWRKGPREEIINSIEVNVMSVLSMDPAAIDALRHTLYCCEGDAARGGTISSVK
ncbi:TPA: NIPSNAP family protein [Aeromonas veronii]